MEHLVTDESVAAHRPSGRYLAVCDAQVLAASLTAPQRSRARRARRVVRKVVSAGHGAFSGVRRRFRMVKIRCGCVASSGWAR